MHLIIYQTSVANKDNEGELYVLPRKYEKMGKDALSAPNTNDRLVYRVQSCLP